jgi:hypothetical protein
MTKPSTNSNLSDAFSRLGWIGFWLQIAIGSIPIALLIYAFLFGGGDGIGTRSRFGLIQYLEIGSLFVLAFTTLWFFRYTQLAHRIAEVDLSPSLQSLHRTAWIGVAASALGIVFSAVVMMFEASQLLLYFLRAPQAGVPVVQTTSGGPASWVSAGDVLSLMGLIVTMLVEVVVLVLSLWLLSRTTAEFMAIYRTDED